jgi:hypothetical protein
MNPMQIKTLSGEVWNEKPTKSLKLSKIFKKIKRYCQEFVLFTLLGNIKD